MPQQIPLDFVQRDVPQLVANMESCCPLRPKKSHVGSTNTDKHDYLYECGKWRGHSSNVIQVKASIL